MKWFGHKGQRQENALPGVYVPTLLGIGLDVSGSMAESIRNDAAMSFSRLDGVEKGLQALVRDTQRLAREHAPDSNLPLRVFAYAFGLQMNPGYGDLLGILRAASLPETQTFLEVSTQRRRQEAEQKGEALRRQAASYGGLASLARSYGFGGIVDGIQQQAESDARARLTAEAKSKVMEDLRGYLKERIGDTTLTLSELAQIWGGSSGSFDRAREFIFGSTPMCGCLQEIESRFARETKKAPGPKEEQVLLLISDGEPTDGQPTDCAKRIQSAGVRIACAFVTNGDVQVPRRLTNRPEPNWNKGAQLMFAMASAIDDLPDAGGYRKILLQAGWDVPAGARLFVQVNHSEVLADFMRLAAVAFPARNLPVLGNLLS